MRDKDAITERQKKRFEQQKAQNKAVADAGDEGVPEGKNSEERVGYQKQMREEYVFGIDINRVESDDVIMQSGCAGTTEPLES